MRGNWRDLAHRSAYAPDRCAEHEKRGVYSACFSNGLDPAFIPILMRSRAGGDGAAGA